jgi:hypothetical protein
MAISYPPIFINDYLREKLSLLLGPESVAFDVPFFPTSPSTIEQLTQGGFPPPNEAGMFGVYDRMFKMRRKAFPHIKDEQLLYYFYSLDIVEMINATQYIADLLDRGDESAQDLNEWIRNNPKTFVKPGGQIVYQPTNPGSAYGPAFSSEEYLPVYFHDLKIFQLEETRDIIDFGTARTYAGNKIIIDYCYHTKGYSNGNTTYNDTTL